MKIDSLYYIMDYSGHYYRTDLSDQLVASSEKDATIFTYTQANSRIGGGKKSSFYCMIPVNGSDENNETLETEGTLLPIKELAYEEVLDPVEKSALSYDLSEMDWVEYLTHFTYIVSGLKGYKNELTQRHSDIDQKICDILHYIELCETNDTEAIDLVKLLRVCRENRREIKDELQRIEYFQLHLGTNANVIKANQALKCMKGMETRKFWNRCIQRSSVCSNNIRSNRRLEELRPFYSLQIVKHLLTSQSYVFHKNRYKSRCVKYNSFYFIIISKTPLG